MEIGSGINILNRLFLLISLLVLLTLLLSSCVLVKDNTKPLILDFTKSATLLSQHMIYFKAKILDTGSGLEKVAFELNHSPLPLTTEGSDVFVANWLGVYGSYSVTVVAQDRAGNVATKTDKFFVADSTPPMIKILSPKKITKDVEFPLTIKAYDLQSGIRNVSLEIDGENVPVSNEETLKWVFPTEGVHHISLTAVNNQGLITTKQMDLNVINERKTPPYAQFVNFPQVLQSDKDATFSVYAYSPNGVKVVELQIGKNVKEIFSSSNNIYNFHFSLHCENNEIFQATCTMYDVTGIKKVISGKILVLSKDSTTAVIFPELKKDLSPSKRSHYLKIPFFVGGIDVKKLNVKAYIDGIPVDVEGDFPQMFTLWRPTKGIHVLAIAVNGKIVKEEEFSYPSFNSSQR